MEVVFDGARTDEEPRADLGVGQAVAGESRDLTLLGGELVSRLDAAFADALAGSHQLSLNSARERASVPSAHSVPVAWAISASHSSACWASGRFPHRAAASISSATARVKPNW